MKRLLRYTFLIASLGIAWASTAAAQSTRVNYARFAKDSLYRQMKEQEIADHMDEYFGKDFRDMELAGFTTYNATVVLDSTGRNVPQLLLHAGKYIITQDAFGGTVEEYAEVQRSLFDVRRDGHFNITDRAECRDEILYRVSKDIKQHGALCENLSVTSLISPDYSNICIRGVLPSKDGVLQSAVTHGVLASPDDFVKGFYKTAQKMGQQNVIGPTLSTYYQTVRQFKLVP